MIKTINNVYKHEYLIKNHFVPRTGSIHHLHTTLNQHIICISSSDKYVIFTWLWINTLFAHHLDQHMTYIQTKSMCYLHPTPDQQNICHYLRSNLLFSRLNMIFVPHLWSTHYLNVILNKRYLNPHLGWKHYLDPYLGSNFYPSWINMGFAPQSKPTC